MSSETIVRPVHASWDGSAVCSGAYGGPNVHPADVPAITCPACRAALAL